MKKLWHVYMVECANQSLYTGITNDLPQRIRDHNCGRGARYTRAFGPVKLVWSEKHSDRSCATKREAKIKRLSRSAKDLLISPKR